MKLFTYWSGKKHDYIKLCEKSMQINCTKLEIVNLDDNNIKEWIPDLRKEVIGKEGTFSNTAYIADYIRWKVLYLHGGIWLDKDFIILDSRFQDKIIKTMEYNDYIGCGAIPEVNYHKCPQNGFISMSKGYIIGKLQIEGMDNLIDSGKKIDWCNLGVDIQKNFMCNYDYAIFPDTYLFPIYWRDWQIFMEMGPDFKAIKPNTIGVALYNSAFPDWFKDMPENDLMGSDRVIANIFKTAYRGGK